MEEKCPTRNPSPLCSVIIPAYNASRFIADTVKSVIAQTFPDWECVVVDDCSTDNTFELVSAIAENEPRLRIIRNKENMRVAKTRMAGVAAARGKHVAFLDSTAEIHSVLTFVWYSVILVVIVLFLGVLNFGGNRLHILIYTALIALIITSVLVLALPYSMIGRQVSKKIIFVMFGEMAILIPLWLLISQRIYFRFCPPVKTIFITDLPTEDWVVDVVNLFSKRYTIVDTISPKSVEIAEKIQSVPAVVIGSLVNEDKQRILCICAAYNKSVLMRPEYTDIMMTKAQTEQCDDLLLILVHSFGLTRSQRLGKRIFDIVFSALALTVALPIILICALFIFLEDKHSPFICRNALL